MRELKPYLDGDGRVALREQNTVKGVRPARSVSVSLPSGAQPGDLIVVDLYLDNTNVAKVTPPVGYTLMSEAPVGTTGRLLSYSNLGITPDLSPVTFTWRGRRRYEFSIRAFGRSIVKPFVPPPIGDPPALERWLDS